MAMFALPKPSKYLTKVEEIGDEMDTSDVSNKKISLNDSYREDRSAQDPCLKIKKTSTTISLLSNDC